MDDENTPAQGDEDDFLRLLDSRLTPIAAPNEMYDLLKFNVFQIILIYVSLLNYF